MRPNTLRVVLGLAMAVVALAFGPKPGLAAGKPTQGPGSGYAVGDIAVCFTALDQSGNEVSLRDFSGSFVLLDFSAVWCAPCHLYASDIQPQVARDLSAAGIPFTTITILIEGGGQGVPSKVRDALIWAKIFKLSTPVLCVNGDANSPLYAQFAAYSVPLAPPFGAYPTFVALGPDQRILATSVGADTPANTEAPFLESLTVNPRYGLVVLENILDSLDLPDSVLDVLSPEVSELAESLDRGHAKKARHSVESFLRKVEHLAAKSVLGPEEASRLESIANTILGALGG